MSNDVNPTDFYEVQSGLIALMDSNLEFWIVSTFAVVIAVHFAGSTISRLLRAIIVFVYVTASVLFAVRILSLSHTFGELNTALVNVGAAPWPQQDDFSAIILLLRGILLMVGTVATVWYVVFTTSREDA